MLVWTARGRDLPGALGSTQALGQDAAEVEQDLEAQARVLFRQGVEIIEPQFCHLYRGRGPHLRRTLAAIENGISPRTLPAPTVITRRGVPMARFGPGAGPPERRLRPGRANATSRRQR